MQSPLKKIIVYDLETGGLSCKFNSITEIAMVAIDMETLKKTDELSIMLKPRLDVRNMEEDNISEAKALYKRLGTKDEVSGIKVLKFGENKITLKNIQPLIDGVSQFIKIVSKNFPNGIIEINDTNLDFFNGNEDILQVYIDSSYNPQALEATKIPFKLLCDEGIGFSEAFEQVNSFIKKHTVGNSKPIISGHNIGWLPRRIVKGKEVGPNGFDNPFMEIFFQDNKSDFFSVINDLIYDTLQMARTKFWELPSFSLGVCANEVGLTLKEAHRALPDTRANADLLIKLLKSLRGDGGQNTKYTRRKFSMNY